MAPNISSDFTTCSWGTVSVWINMVSWSTPISSNYLMVLMQLSGSPPMIAPRSQRVSASIMQFEDIGEIPADHL